jgi:hypothetical protein
MFLFSVWNGAQLRNYLQEVGPANQQDYSNFFTTSTVLDLPSNSQWKLQLLILFHSWKSWSWRRVLIWPRKCTGNLFIQVVICTSSPTTHITCLIGRSKVICQDQMDFNKEIQNVRHDLILNKCPQEFLDPVMKPSRSNRPSDTIYQGTVIIPYVKDTSDKYRRIWNRFSWRTIFKTKHTLRGTLMKTGPVRDAQQTTWCVHNIPCDCGRCYIGETSRLLEVRIKKHKYSLPKFCLKNQNWPNMSTKNSTKYVGKKRRSCRLNQTQHTGNTRNLPTSLIDHLISQPRLDISNLDSRYIRRWKKLQLCPA